MAVNTRNRRASCLSFSLQNLGRVFPNPDASLANQADRQHLAFLYAAVLTLIVVSLFDGLTTSLRLTGVGR